MKSLTNSTKVRALRRGLLLRRGLPGLALGACLACAALPLHAQSNPDPGTPPPPGWSFSYIDNGLSAPSGFTRASGSGAWGQAFAPDGASVAGPVTAWFVWGGPGLSPPLYTRWSASAGGDPYSPGGSVTVDDGLGDTPVPSEYGATPGSMTSSGLHLKQAGAGTQPGGLVSAGTASPSATGYGPANVYVSVGLTLDTRGLTISSDNGAKYKQLVAGQFDANGDPICVQAQHTPDADGTMRGDAGLPFGINGPSSDNYASISYTAHPAGNWTVPSSSYNWFSSLKQNDDSGTLVDFYNTIPVYTNRYAEPYPDAVNNLGPDQLPPISPGDTRKVDHIHLTYTDSPQYGDGASATANFYMTLHQPEEFTKSMKSTVLVPGLPANFYYQAVGLTVDNPGYAVCPGGIDCTWNVPGAYWDWGSNGLSVLSNYGPPSLQAFLTAASISVTKLAPQAYKGTAPWAWGVSASTFPADHPKGSLPQSLYHMTPRLYELYEMHYTLDDHYDMNGYGGTKPVSGKDDQGPGEWYGDFTYYPSPAEVRKLMKTWIVSTVALVVVAGGVYTADHSSIHQHTASQYSPPPLPPPRITAQEGRAWADEAWTKDPLPYQHIEQETDRALASGQDPKALVAQDGATAQADAANPQALFRWGYSQWRAITPPYGSGDKYLYMTPVFEAMVKAPSPKTYEYARLRYLASPNDAYVVDVGERLLRRNLGDMDVRYRLIVDYEGLISVSGLRTHEVNVRAKTRALSLAQGMMQAMPSVAKYHAAIGGVYATCWGVTHGHDDAAKAVAGYRDYLRLATPDDTFRPQAEGIIKDFQKSLVKQ